MRDLRHYLLAALAVIGVAGLAALTTSQTSPPLSTLTPASVRIEYAPHPRDMVQVRQGTPYVVPLGKLFVLTALGTDYATPAHGQDVRLFIDGVVESQMRVTTNPYGPTGMTSMVSIPPGQSIAGGAVLTVQAQDPDLLGRAWGYLTSNAVPLALGPAIVRVPYQPHPSDMVQIVGGSPFAVPPGKLLVITALGGTGNTLQGADPYRLHINGELEFNTWEAELYVAPTMAAVPLGLSVPAGSVVEARLDGPDQTPARAWGYLASQ